MQRSRHLGIILVHPDVAYSWDEEDDKNVDMGSNRGKQITLEKADHHVHKFHLPCVRSVWL